MTLQDNTICDIIEELLKLLKEIQGVIGDTTK